MAQLPSTRQNRGGRLARRMSHPLNRLQRDLETLFGPVWGDWLSPEDRELGSMRMLDFNITENEKEIVIRAEVPGFEENEIDVQLNRDVLTIKAEKEQKEEGHEEYRTFFRSITLPSEVEAEKAQAKYHNGVLELHFPKAEQTQSRRVPVQGHQKQQIEAGAGPKKEGDQSGSREEQTRHQGGSSTSQKSKK